MLSPLFPKYVCAQMTLSIWWHVFLSCQKITKICYIPQDCIKTLLNSHYSFESIKNRWQMMHDDVTAYSLMLHCSQDMIQPIQQLPTWPSLDATPGSKNLNGANSCNRSNTSPTIFCHYHLSWVIFFTLQCCFNFSTFLTHGNGSSDISKYFILTVSGS